MVPPRWAPLDITQYPIPGGFIFRLITDVPCHLWMVYSHQQPWYHPKTVILRGLPTWQDTRICFVAPHFNEQEEAGDTLIHTFLKPDWPVCQTRWFYFRGTIAGIVSPSNTAIFEKHRDAVEYELTLLEEWSETLPTIPALANVIIEEWSS